MIDAPEEIQAQKDELRQAVSHARPFKRLYVKMKILALQAAPCNMILAESLGSIKDAAHMAGFAGELKEKNAGLRKSCDRYSCWRDSGCCARL